MAEDSATLLAAIPLFRDLPGADLQRLLASAARRTYPRGQVLFSAGDPGDSLLVVLAGRVQVVVHSADGAELMLTVVPAGGLLGELGVVDGGPRSAGAATLERTELLSLRRSAVLALVADRPEVGTRLMESLASHLRRLTGVTADLVFLDLPRRLAKLLLESDGSPGGAGLNQTQLAARIGGTRQSVNAALAGFERRGWIQMEGRQVLLHDPSALSRFAGATTRGAT